MRTIALTSLLMLTCLGLSAQNITGQTTVNVGETHTYTFSNGTLYPFQNWVCANGSILSKWSSGSTYYASVQFTSAGSTTVRFLDQSYIQRGSLNVTVAVAVPNTTFGTSQVCGSTTITRNTNPPSGVTWYWQSSASGTSTSNSSTTYAVVASATYYLRARSGTTWSTASQSTGSVTVLSSPGTPGSATHGHAISDDPVEVPVSVGTVSGAASYKWYSAASGGTLYASTSVPSLAQTLPSTRTYYVAAVIGSCESPARKQVTANVYPEPVISATGNGIIPRDSSVTLSVSNYAYDTYQWLNEAGDDISGATSASFITEEPGVYSVNVTKGTAAAVDPPDAIVCLQNYVITSNIMVRDVATPDSANALSIGNRLESVQYIDGLGRLKQTVVRQGSMKSGGSAKDLVLPVVYDQFGREFRKYLPYAAYEGEGFYQDQATLFDSNGNYLHNFYNSGVTTIPVDTRPFAEIEFDESPLMKVSKSFGPGQAWHTAGKFVRTKDYVIDEGTSAGKDKVIVWKISGGSPEVDTSVNNGYYATGQLMVMSSINEDSIETREYKDHEGRLVMKMTYVAGTRTDYATTGSAGNWARTYYLYDDFNNLRFVLQPALSKKFVESISYAVTDDDLDELACQYKYDARQRETEKKLPGKGWMYTVYDKLDRVVLTQDSTQRAGKYWTFTKYDALNRVILTGIMDYATAQTQSQMQAIVDTYYAGGGATLFETFVGDTADDIHGYTNTSYPVYTTASTANKDHYLGVTYYDNYNFKSMWLGSYDYVNDSLQATELEAYSQPSAAHQSVGLLVTGTKIKVLDGGVRGGYQWLKSVNYYDEKKRVVQVITDNNKGGEDRTSSLYDFTGRVLKTKTTQITRDVTWKDKVAVIEIGSKLVTTSTGSWGTSGSVSIETLAPGTNGWIEVTASETNTNRMFGFSDNNTSTHHNTIDYAFYLNAGTLKVYENGQAKCTIGTYKPGDVLRIERVGTTINYYQNGGSALCPSATPSSSLLMMDNSFNAAQGSLLDCRASFALDTQTITRTFDYDFPLNRLEVIKHRVNDDSTVTLVKNNYNELGQLVLKQLHHVDATLYLQDIDYRYNIRSWLTRINNPNAPDGKDLFNMILYYNTPTANGGTPRYDGNISEWIWSTAGLDRQSYGYAYDGMARLLEGTYFNLAKPDRNGDYTERVGTVADSIGYDLNGNILRLQRYGKIEDGVYGLMDDLTYGFLNSGRSNKLNNVTDAVTTNIQEEGFIEVVEGSTDYGYDGNGNMTLDNNKGLTAVAYNFLNLPEKANKGSSDYIVFVYDAGGRKLSQHAFGAAPEHTKYSGEFVYRNDTLAYILHDEGSVVPDTAQGAADPWLYQYFIKDHLGNVRALFSENSAAAEYKATLETTTQGYEQSTFANYSRVDFNLFDHTDTGGTYSYAQLLNGGNNAQVGLAKSFEVNPGDVFDLEVYAKYEEPGSTNNSVNDLFNALIAAFNISSSTGAGLEGPEAYSAFSGLFGGGPYIGTGDYEDPLAPRAYLNYILFDENFNLLDFGFDQVSIDAEQDGATPVIPHDYLSLHVKVNQKGYLYIYLSNEQAVETNVYFDDCKIVKHTGVLQAQDYYPFGLTYNTIDFTTGNANKYKFQGQERLTTLNLRWDQFKWRNYMPDVGRFFNIDPLAEKYVYNSTYAFSENKVVNGIEIEGLEFLNSTTLTYVEGGVAGGLGYGAAATIKLGVAYDMVGKTEFRTGAAFNNVSSLKEGSTNPKYILGSEASVNTGFEFIRKPTFLQAEAAKGLSVPFDVGAKLGGGAGITVSDEIFGLSVGYGLGATFKTGDQDDIIFSLSLTYGESNQISFGENWGAGLSKAIPVLDADNNVIGFKAKLTVRAVTSNYKQSKYVSFWVYSGVEAKDEGEVSNGIWQSAAYTKESQRYLNK